MGRTITEGGVKQNPAPVPPLVSVKLSRRAQAAILRRGSGQSQLSRTNMPALEDWFGRKLAAQRGIDQAREVRYRHHRGSGPGSYYAEINLRVEPSAEFGFAWEADVLSGDGPADEAFRAAVFDGVLDELLVPNTEVLGGIVGSDFRSAVTLVRVTVIRARLHPVDSNPRAFYFAARGAIRDVHLLASGRTPRGAG